MNAAVARVARVATAVPVSDPVSDLETLLGLTEQLSDLECESERAEVGAAVAEALVAVSHSVSGERRNGIAHPSTRASHMQTVGAVARAIAVRAEDYEHGRPGRRADVAARLLSLAEGLVELATSVAAADHADADADRAAWLSKVASAANSAKGGGA